MSTLPQAPPTPEAGAQLSAAVAALFPQGVFAAELHADRTAPVMNEDPAAADARASDRARELLSEAEWRSIAHCSAPRIRDFTAGRLCAHRALQALGADVASLLSADDRRPLWPPAVSGSITHTDGYAAAVVGRLAQVGSLGLDSERIEEVKPALWGGICTPAELGQLEQRPAATRAVAAALCFVAKEAFYKAQFALCGERLGFHDVRIALSDVTLAQGRFEVHPLRPLRLQTLPGPRAPDALWTGRFRCDAGQISAGIALPARIE